MLAQFFRARPLVWIDGRELEIAGRYAWRTRISDLRRVPYCMNIENRQRRIERPDGTTHVVSEYRFVPDAEMGRSAAGNVSASPLLF